jgi:PEP-CTERM motif-containing protein
VGLGKLYVERKRAHDTHDQRRAGLSQTGGWPNNDGSIVTGEIDVFTTGAPTADLLDACGAGGLTFDVGCIQNANVLATSGDVMSTASVTNGSLAVSAGSFQLTTPGETIFVLMSFDAWANQGGFVNAADTFATTFSSEAGLTPALSVPEPATLALLSLGVGALGFVTRRKATTDGRRSARDECPNYKRQHGYKEPRPRSTFGSQPAG